jgi:cell division protein FtsI (penicillin-binding protein 3)
LEVRRDILWRVYLSFLGIVLLGMFILGRSVYIQQVEGDKWLALANKQQQRVIELEAARGTIYSEDGSMLSTSIPYFDIYIDFGAEGLRNKEGKLFRENLDSLSVSLAGLFKDRSAAEYKRILQEGYKKKHRYFLLKRNLSFDQYKKLRQFPLVRLGKNKSGFIAEVKDKRLNPFGLLANRTIGLSRTYRNEEGKIVSTNVGLEKTYDDVLKGESGKRLVRYLAGGVYKPVEGPEIEPRQGKDIISTIDVNIQDIVEHALLKMMVDNEAVHGTAIVMEVKTGKIKAIANLGRTSSGEYWEDLNYGLLATEPGSTFKLATMLALLEDGYVNLNDKVNLEKGSWRIGRRTVFDSERHGREEVTIRQAFEYSSNVAMAKLVNQYYGKKPDQFIKHLKKLGLDQPTGVDLVGESQPVIKTQKSKTWSATTLPWMSFGYEVLISPLQTLTLYNAVANEGRMMKPYLVNAVVESGTVVEKFEPVDKGKICDDKTLRQLHELLIGTCSHEGATGYRLFKDAGYKVAGKTGTALVANGNRGYADRIYQSSFAGYFPADNPVYSCIVVIKNKPFAQRFYGASVAGPVFKEIADKLYALQAGNSREGNSIPDEADSSMYKYAGASSDIREVLGRLEFNYEDNASFHEWSNVSSTVGYAVVKSNPVTPGIMPDLMGMGLKDALYLLESMQVKVIAEGKGKIAAQYPLAGTRLNKNQSVKIELR